MPRLPRYESSAQLTRQDPGQAVNPEIGGQSGKMIQEGASELGKLNQKFVELKTLNDVNEESRKLRDGLSNLKMEYANDPDIGKNRGTYISKMDELRAKAGESIFDGEAKMKFRAQAEAEVDSEKIRFSGKLVDHNMNIARADLLTNIQGYKEKFAETGDPKWMKVAEGEIRNGLTVGFISADNALRIGESLNKDFTEFAVDRDAIIDPTMAKQKVIANKYPFMDQETKTKTLADLDKKIKARNKANRFKFENLQDRTELEHATAFIQGKGDIDKFREDEAVGLIEKESADAMAKFQASPYGEFQKLSQADKDRLDQSLDVKVYNDLLKRSYTAKGDNARKLFRDMFNAGSEGKITPSAMEQIFGNFNTEYQHAVDGKQNFDNTVNGIKSAAIDSARAAFQFMADPEKLVFDFAGRMAKIPKNTAPEDLQKQLSGTIKLMVQAQAPEVFGLDDVPQNLYSALGLVRKIWNGEVDASNDKRKTK